MFTHRLYSIGQINNAGTNKGFRPLLEFTEEDITQVKSFLDLKLNFSLSYCEVP